MIIKSSSLCHCRVFQPRSHTHPLCPIKTDLGNEDQTERDGATKDDHQRYNAELDIGLVPRQKRHRGANDAHDSDVVHAHSDIFAIVKSGNAHIPGLPCQKAPKQL